MIGEIHTIKSYFCPKIKCSCNNALFIYINPPNKPVVFLLKSLTMKYLFMYFLIIPVCESYGIQNHPIMSGFEEDQKKGKSSDPDSSYIYKKILTNEILKRDIAMTTSDIEKWNYSIHNLSHRRRSFEWQLLSSRFIFFYCHVRCYLWYNFFWATILPILENVLKIYEYG